MSKGYTFTKADFDRLKASDAKKTPAQRRAINKALVEANSKANNTRKTKKA